ncbi:putative cfem domain-containing protein [Zalerion maritima]|uniref:Cfem domain-containing protein n=1 Tax=Zalerion maritima TaxID=339359 RepID=A0AAD5RV88_9PEZI|nr:putative cfem domain-containing protein [Zalerion maritima]
MRYSAVVFAAVVGLATAQSPGDYFPECALDCLDSAVSSVTDCTVDDSSCQCEDANQSAIQTAATSCIIEACGSDVAINEVLPAAAEFCAAVAAGGDDTATTSAEETTAEETTPAETTAEETTPAETTAAETTAAEEETTMTTMETSTPTAAGNGTATTSTPVEVNAASGRSAGGVAALLLAALAAF